MIFERLPLNGAFIIKPMPISDDRGEFARFFCKEEFKRMNLETEFVQHSVAKNTKTGTLRGLHFQRPPFEEIKIVRCLNGKIYDVIVDIRQSSATFGRWAAVELSSENLHALYVPAGFAHGYITLTDYSDVYYMISEYYDVNSAETIVWNDSRLQIEWPARPKQISLKDSTGMKFTELHI